MCYKVQKGNCYIAIALWRQVSVESPEELACSLQPILPFSASCVKPELNDFNTRKGLGGILGFSFTNLEEETPVKSLFFPAL